MQERFKKRKRVLDRYMKTAPFARLVDKLTFIFGVAVVMITTFAIGKWPNNYYYIWHMFIVNSLVLYRIKMYYELKQHYYLFDFCYFANILMTSFFVYYPKD